MMPRLAVHSALPEDRIAFCCFYHHEQFSRDHVPTQNDASVHATGLLLFLSYSYQKEHAILTILSWEHRLS
jgi:hypothetical protein